MRGKYYWEIFFKSGLATMMLIKHLILCWIKCLDSVFILQKILLPKEERKTFSESGEKSRKVIFSVSWSWQHLEWEESRVSMSLSQSLAGNKQGKSRRQCHSMSLGNKNLDHLICITKGKMWSSLIHYLFPYHWRSDFFHCFRNSGNGARKEKILVRVLELR